MILVAGSFAWFSMTQRALNVFEFIPAGVNLHDLFDPDTGMKNVFVENSGDDPLIVRVRFREYMEFTDRITGSRHRFPSGPDDYAPGLPYGGGGGAFKPWMFHTANCTLECSGGCGEDIHTYWDWIFGGEATQNHAPDCPNRFLLFDAYINPCTCTVDNNNNFRGGRWYVPADEDLARWGATSRRDNQTSWTRPVVDTRPLVCGLPHDFKFLGEYINGIRIESYDGLLEAIGEDTASVTDWFGIDIEEGLLNSFRTALGNAITGAASPPTEADQIAVNTVRESLYRQQMKINNYMRQHYGVHLAHPIVRPAGIAGDGRPYITMLQWDAHKPAPGNYWIMDEDGWFYWGNPLEPGEATGLLLSQVLGTDALAELRNGRSRYYYGIDVIMQAVTAESYWRFWDTQLLDIQEYGEALAHTGARQLLFRLAEEIILTPPAPRTGIDPASATLNTGLGAAASRLGVTLRSGFWTHIGNNVWTYDDGRWRFDANEWTLYGEEYDFDPDGWFLVDGDWCYIDDDWLFDGHWWYELNPPERLQPQPEPPTATPTTPPTTTPTIPPADPDEDELVGDADPGALPDEDELVGDADPGAPPDEEEPVGDADPGVPPEEDEPAEE